MKIRMIVDWLSLTFPNDDMPPNEAMVGVWKHTGNGLHGYRRKYVEHGTGAVLQTMGAPGMGSHLTLTGDAMATIRSGGIDDRTLAQEMVDKDARASRIDLAIDVIDSELTVAWCEGALKDGGMTTTARSTMALSEASSSGEETGRTLYIGSRQSDRFMRIYDKRLESKVQDVTAWTRLEIELKNLIARGAVGSVAENGVESTVRGIAGSMIQMNHYVWKEIMTGEIAEPPKAGKKNTKTEQWLLGTVAGTLAKVISNKPEFWDEFLVAVAENSVKMKEYLENQGN